jgi:hypothetical protein
VKVLEVSILNSIFSKEIEDLLSSEAPILRAMNAIKDREA